MQPSDQERDQDDPPLETASAAVVPRAAGGRFAVGNPGNPNASGRPKGQPEMLTSELRRILSEPGPGGVQYRHQLAVKLLELALDGDLVAIKYVYDRVDGRPPEMVDHAGELGLLVQVVPWVRKVP